MFRIFLFLCLLAFPARAEMPAGHDDPRFQAAVEAWLDADDEASLPVMAELAREGNIAAQILLGRIDLRRAAPGPWLSTLSDQQRKALFRAPGGKFPRSWLAVAAETSPLAKALQDSRFLPDHSETLENLIDLGETRVAAEFAWRMVNAGKFSEVDRIVRGRTESAQLNDIAAIASVLALFQTDPDAALKVQKSARASAERQSWRIDYFLGTIWDTPNTSRQRSAEMAWALGGHVPDSLKAFEIGDDVVDLAMQVAEAGPLARLCEMRCSPSPHTCYRMGHRIIGGLYALEGIGSPLQAVIPEDAYHNSPRAEETVLRAIVGNTSVYPRLIDRAWGPKQWDLCLANLVRERLE